MIHALFFIPVANNDTGRVVWTVRSIRKYCPGSRIFLLLDGPKANALDQELIGPDLTVSENPVPTGRHWGKIWQMQCKAMVKALADPAVAPTAIFVKIDADAVVLRAGLVERAQGLFASRPSAGQLGQCFTNVLGGRLQNAGWANYFVKMCGWRGLRHFVQGGHQEKTGLLYSVKAFVALRKLLRSAHRNGYVDGEFAIGGSYILRREVVQSLGAQGVLDQSPFLLLRNTGEDGVMTPYVYAAGFAAMDDVADEGLFAIEGKELRIDPFVLKLRGHYIIHPTKYGHTRDGHNLTEEELVARLV